MCKPIWPWHTMAHGGGAAILVRIERRTTARDDHPTSDAAAPSTCPEREAGLRERALEAHEVRRPVRAPYRRAAQPARRGDRCRPGGGGQGDRAAAARQQLHHPETSNNPNASRCRRTCPGARSATSPSPPPVPLRLPDEAHRRGRGREAGLRARRVQRRAPYPRQVGLRPSAKPGPGAGAAHVIDKGIPTTGLLAQVLVAKYADHLPLYRQEAIFGRAGLAIPARPWRSGWAPAACSCSRWSMRSRPRCSAQRAACRRDAGGRCSSRATARRTGPTCGPMRPGAFEDHEGRGLRLLRVARRRTRPAPSWAIGRAAWSATTTPATRQLSPGRDRGGLPGARPAQVL
jgi:hypothetical protein